MDYSAVIAKKSARFSELEAMVNEGSVFNDQTRARAVMQEHSQVKLTLAAWEAHERLVRQIAENRELASSEDAEMAEMARAELPGLETELMQAARNLQVALLPPDPAENRDAIVEIRGGTGGMEAALFAADLLRMYQRYAEVAGLRCEVLELSPSDLGGVKEATFRMSGEAVFRKLRFESGVHRVQRVPATEAQGRIHTSTATVAVLPEAEEVDFEIRPEDLRIEVCRAGGPGGQGVNTTDSAVQVMHIPTGKIVRCQDGRSQQKNKERALQILRARLLEEKQREEAEKYSAHRRSLIGTGGREEKIRTYNFPQNRVTDHRIGLTLHSLDRFVQGDLQEMLDALLLRDLEDRLAGITEG